MFSDQAREELGWSQDEARAILRGLGYVPAARAAPGEPQAWRRRGEAPAARSARPQAASPFAALAALQAPPPAPPRAKRRRRKAGAARPS